MIRPRHVLMAIICIASGLAIYSALSGWMIAALVQAFASGFASGLYVVVRELNGATIIREEK